MKKKVLKSRFIIPAVILFAWVALGCGEENTGGINFQLVWKIPVPVSFAASLKPQSLPSGVVSLRVTVSSPDMSNVVKSFPDLDPAGGYIDVKGVHAGDNRTVLLEGLDSNDGVTYQGEKTGITVEKGKITDSGTITMEPVTSANLPLAPSNLTANPISSSQISLQWQDNSDNEENFKIERKAGSSGSYIQIAVVNSNVNTYQDYALTCETEYYYQVRATNSDGDSNYSNEVPATTLDCPSTTPAAPSNLAAGVVSSSQINLNWSDNSDNEDGFAIERKTGAGGTYAQIGTVNAGTASYQDPGLVCDMEYYYRVTAYNGMGSSVYSNEANATTSACPLTAPTAPSGLTATVVSATQINLSWTDNSSNEDGFKIERKTGVAGTYSQITSVGIGVTSYQDSGLICKTTYFYRARAFNSVGDSNYSNEIGMMAGDCPLTVPTAPSNLQATVVSFSQINLSWTDNSNNEDGFKIERKTGAGGTYSLIKTTSANATSYSDTGLSPSTTYYYQVYAYNTAGSSGSSNEANSTTTQSGGTPGQMAAIPAGCFNMGDAFSEGYSNELPVHNVCLTAFQMNVYEVTNAQYKACVDAGSCTAPGSSASSTRSSYYGSSTYDNYPVIYMDWSQAKAFCQWTGGRLSTEAEWEYAARGGLSGKRYPWGDDAPTCTLGSANGAQYAPCSPDDTIQVGSFAPNGYGLYDMTGNVWEWVNDWYSDTYYSSSLVQDPQGPSSGTYRVLRGGSWNNSTYDLRVALRYGGDPTAQVLSLGFRCVR